MEFKCNKICRQKKSEAYMCMYLNVMHHVGEKPQYVKGLINVKSRGNIYGII